MLTFIIVEEGSGDDEYADDIAWDEAAVLAERVTKTADGGDDGDE
jgi:hypothetical protein